MKMTMPAVPERLRDSGGFALAMAVFALVVLAAVVAGGYFSAAQEFQIGRGMRSVTSSFYASEMGIVSVIESWDPGAADDLNPGDTLAIGPQQLTGGGRYSAIAVRVDDGSEASLRYFYIEAAGRPPSPAQGERRQAILARARYPNLCCEAAITTVDPMDTGGGSPSEKKIYGDDTVPTGWGDACTDIPLLDLPAAQVPDASVIDSEDLARLEGTPQYIEDPTVTDANIMNLGELTYAELVEFADFTFADGKSFSGSSASTVDGECNKEDPDNWGAPNNTNSPCFDFFPIIHVTGDLDLNGPGVGQGILLVDEHLTISGTFEFYGIAFIDDNLYMSGGADFYGGAYVEDELHLSSAPARFFFSNCVVERAVRYSNLTRPLPLPGRPWVELF